MGQKQKRVETESPSRVKIERQNQKRVETESPSRVKIERQKQKRVENRLSKHEANPKPIVKVRKQVKNRNIAEIITVKLAKYTKTPTAKIAKTPNREF